MYGYQVFTLEHRQRANDGLVDVARLTDNRIVLVESLVADLRGRKILRPPAGIIGLVCAEALARANRRIYNTLAGSLNDGHRAGSPAALAASRLSEMARSFDAASF